MSHPKNARLTEIYPYKDENLKWFFRLMYEYEDSYGIHKIVIPKAMCPIPQTEYPIVNGVDPDIGVTLSNPYISCHNQLVLKEDTCLYAMAHGVEKPAYFFDILTEPIVKEMTVAEIEKELGYKVKIVNEKRILQDAIVGTTK